MDNTTHAVPLAAILQSDELRFLWIQNNKTPIWENNGYVREHMPIY
jgi:hypothetical protein